MRFRLGDHVHDVTDRTLVMGILNRTPDSFFDAGETFELDALLRRAEQLVAEGADVLDVGGVKAGPGPEVTEAEELDRRRPADRGPRRALRRRRCRSTRGGRPCCGRRARPAPSSATTSAASPIPTISPSPPSTGRRSSPRTSVCAPRVPDPEPRYDDLVGEVRAFLLDRAGAAEAAGLAPEQIALDPGLDLGKTPAQSAVLLRESDAFASLGYTLLLSASNKRFLGELLDLGDRRPPRRVAGRRRVRRHARLPDRARARRCRIGQGVPDDRGGAGVRNATERASRERGRLSARRVRSGAARRGARTAARRARRGRRSHARGRGVHGAGQGRARRGRERRPERSRRPRGGRRRRTERRARARRS